MKNRLHVMLLMMPAGGINRHQQEMIGLEAALRKVYPRFNRGLFGLKPFGLLWNFADLIIDKMAVPRESRQDAGGT